MKKDNFPFYAKHKLKFIFLYDTDIFVGDVCMYKYYHLIFSF